MNFLILLNGSKYIFSYSYFQMSFITNTDIKFFIYPIFFYIILDFIFICIYTCKPIQ